MTQQIEVTVCHTNKTSFCQLTIKNEVRDSHTPGAHDAMQARLCNKSFVVDVISL